MALLTPLSPVEARALGARYGLEVVAVQPILAGSVNSNFELTLTGGVLGGDTPRPERAFLRVFEEQVLPAAEREAALLDHLCAGGVATPRPMQLPGTSRFVTEHAGKPVSVFPWVDGEILCQARVTPARARRVGAALARVHRAGSDFAGAAPSRFDAEALRGRLEGLPASARSGALGGAVDTLRRKLDGLGSQAVARAPVIHGDLFRDNVLWSPGEDGEVAALLDFESASRGLFSFDLMVTVLAWCFGERLEHDLVRAMVAGYVDVRPLPAEDRVELFDQGRFAAVRFAVTRITDFELRPRGSGVYKDYRRFLERLAALEALGPRGLDEVMALGSSGG